MKTFYNDLDGIGPMLEHWTMLEVMRREAKRPGVLQTWERPVRKLTIQLRMEGEMLSMLISD